MYNDFATILQLEWSISNDIISSLSQHDLQASVISSCLLFFTILGPFDTVTAETCLADIADWSLKMMTKT